MHRPVAKKYNLFGTVPEFPSIKYGQQLFENVAHLTLDHNSLGHSSLDIV